MKPGSYLINTSRAEVVDQAALKQAVNTKGIRAGLDVFANEPAGATGDFNDEIVTLPNVYGTHHIGASTDQAQEAIAAETVRIISAFKETGKVPNVVNLADHTPATHLLVVRHQDRPGVLAYVLNEIKAAKSTCSGWRTSSSPARRRRSRASSWTARSNLRRWTASAPVTAISLKSI